MANIMIQGTTSSAGKSLMCAGLCRIFKEEGFRVYPFKSQNMSSSYYLNSKGHKISASQSLQAIACGLLPESDMNPILLIPKTDNGSMVVINGEEKEDMEALEYFKFRPTLKKMILEVYRKVEAASDIVVIEGAGSPAEINLKENDIVNMGMAEMADAPVVLVGDIDLGGVFASLAGTMLLLTEAERARVKGVIINKFRGDIELLKPGIEMLEDIIKVPVLGVLPYMKLNFNDEDGHLSHNSEEHKKLREKEYDRLAEALRAHLDINAIYDIVNSQ